MVLRLLIAALVGAEPQREPPLVAAEPPPPPVLIEAQPQPDVGAPAKSSASAAKQRSDWRSLQEALISTGIIALTLGAIPTAVCVGIDSSPPSLMLARVPIALIPVGGPVFGLMTATKMGLGSLYVTALLTQVIGIGLLVASKLSRQPYIHVGVLPADRGFTLAMTGRY